MIKTYCTQNAGDCITCGLVSYGKDCQGHSVRRKKGEMKSKRRRVLQHYSGHHGFVTMKTIEDGIKKVWSDAYDRLTAKQYGMLMSIANNSYQSAKNKGNIAEWAYDGKLDWLAGIGDDGSICVDGDNITIRIGDNKMVYKKIEE